MLHLVYGGTFDPFHNGHLAIARAARDELGCVVWLLPAADPPHRTAPGAIAEQRAAMLELAIGDEPGLRIDRRELRRAERDAQSRSYTIDTLRELRSELGSAAPLALLLGADSFAGLPTWHEWRSLFDFAHIVIAERQGNLLDGESSEALIEATTGRWLQTPDGLSETPAGRLFRLQQPLRDESATDIRRRIAAGLPWKPLLPVPVAEFILQNGLYRQPTL
jgi:nicotinate-nucleotide adenylyltransferase